MEEAPKYIITDIELKRPDFPESWERQYASSGMGDTVRRIMAARDFQLIDGTWVRAGELGGFVEWPVTRGEALSQEGSCWLSGETACIANGSYVSGNAIVKDSFVTTGSTIRDSATVVNSVVARLSTVEDYARVYDSTLVGCRVVHRAIVSDSYAKRRRFQGDEIHNGATTNRERY